jgi:hypothetical protein
MSDPEIPGRIIALTASAPAANTTTSPPPASSSPNPETTKATTNPATAAAPLSSREIDIARNRTTAEAAISPKKKPKRTTGACSSRYSTARVTTTTAVPTPASRATRNQPSTVSQGSSARETETPPSSGVSARTPATKRPGVTAVIAAMRRS